MSQAIDRKPRGFRNLLVLLLLAAVGCAAEVASEEGQTPAEIGSSTQALVASTPHWYRICTKGASGVSCKARDCQGGYVACTAAGSCSCQSSKGQDVADVFDGKHRCLSDEFVQCSDRGTGMGCYCARGMKPLLPQDPLSRYPLELAASTSDDVATTLVRFDDGTVWGWGNSTLIPGAEQEEEPAPRQIQLEAKATRITAGARSACALLENGTVTCWGRFALIDWTGGRVTISDVRGTPLSGFIGLTHGEDHACAWRADGHTFCWGSSTYHRYGGTVCRTDDEEVDYAVEVPNVKDAKQVVASTYNTCFLRKNGAVACLGANHVGQLGVGGVADNDLDAGTDTCVKPPPSDTCQEGTAIPTNVDLKVLDVALTLSGGGAASFCAESARHGTQCWGGNDNDHLAYPDAFDSATGKSKKRCLSPSPFTLSRSEGPTHVFGPYNTCAWSPRGGVACWGARGTGLMLEEPVEGQQSEPKSLPGVQNITSLAVGAAHACYAGEGAIRCWGQGEGGRLGNGDTTDTTTLPVAVTDFRSNRQVKGDMNRDGRADLVVTGGPGWTSVPIGLSNGDGSFTTLNPDIAAHSKFPAWAASKGVKTMAGDFNGDGLNDVALAGGPKWNDVAIAFADGVGNFTVTDKVVADSNFGVRAGEANVRIVPGDFDGDEKTDLALVGGATWDDIPIALSKGDGTFRVVDLKTPNFAGWARDATVKVVPGDFDGNGKSDIALLGGPKWKDIAIAFSKGDGNFTVTDIVVAGSNFGLWAGADGVKALAGDFDGDGKSDIALSGPSTWNDVPVAFSKGDGTFEVEDPLFADFASRAAQANVRIVSGDYDGDGRSDLALLGGAAWTDVPIAFSTGRGAFRLSDIDNTDLASWAKRATNTILSEY